MHTVVPQVEQEWGRFILDKALGFPQLNLKTREGISRTEKGTQRTCATKILPNFRVNFLVRFASKRFLNPLFYCAVSSNCSENSLVLFVRFFGFGVPFWPLIILALTMSGLLAKVWSARPCNTILHCIAPHRIAESVLVT